MLSVFFWFSCCCRSYCGPQGGRTWQAWSRKAVWTLLLGPPTQLQWMRDWMQIKPEKIIQQLKFKGFRRISAPLKGPSDWTLNWAAMSGFRHYQTANAGSGVKVWTTLAVNESPAQITAAENSHGVQRESRTPRSWFSLNAQLKAREGETAADSFRLNQSAKDDKDLSVCEQRHTAASMSTRINWFLNARLPALLLPSL